jgi:hypothetical protein
MNKLLFFILLFFVQVISYSQEQNLVHKKKWNVSMAIGAQMSGIKSEDFVKDNYSPAFLLSAGVWVSPDVALQLNYKGNYFHTISDDDRHYYHFIFGDVAIDILKFLNIRTKIDNDLHFLIHIGAGYFYNKHYMRPNVCGNLGLSINYSMLDRIDIFIDISAILGWDIYQGDKDILPSVNFGLRYKFLNGT